MRRVDQVVMALLILAGINWGLWGLFEFNLIYYVFGKDWINRLVYVILGFCGVYYLVGFKNIATRWASKKK